ncbi:phospholipase D-like domain-containing protein [Sabulicella rubraurantiaca]|uniref:phospholipase D-like domain-containing protein n=1 Tax=Sabulicella rubraurantiaca TaxID=2811429 RepID=UPI001A97187A|nr:phospholipase D-like domain-containing protein [Sabulicella rubraurantiaca]
MVQGDTPGRREAMALLLGLGGCASFPDLPDRGIADAPLFREAMADAPLLQGNAVGLLAGGPRVLIEVFRMIEAARDHVHLEFFIVEDVRRPGSGELLFDLLRRKLREGVAVNVIYDSLGSSRTSRAEFDALREAGARLLSFNPANPLEVRRAWRPNHRTHRKILVVDGRVALTGGANLHGVYANRCGPGAVDPEVDPEEACWDDVGLRIEGPAVLAFQRLFLDTWESQGGGALAPRDWFPAPRRPGPTAMRVLGSSPVQGRPLFHVARLAALEAARRSAIICTGYFVPAPREMTEILRAARRGVAVSLLLPGASDHAMPLHIQRSLYGDLLEAGARIFEVHDRVMHAKLAVVDGEWSAVGSSNLDRRSAAWNDEVDAILFGPEFGGALERLLGGRIAGARAVTLAEWRARPFGQRVREMLSWSFADQL